MEHLTSQDLCRLFEFLHNLYELRDHDAFKQHLVRGIADLVPADVYSYNEISPSKKLLTAYAIWPAEFPLPRDTPEIVGRYQHQIHAHTLSDDGQGRGGQDFGFHELSGIPTNGLP